MSVVSLLSIVDVIGMLFAYNLAVVADRNLVLDFDYRQYP